ncbi:MAG: carbohydrate binding family 9 domain-containing protein, partial [Cyclobacteriaceae bacterium]|nr:carbohydrate binding family 9 domain-containing protein [Cyclobacteriaceae bacterium]
TVSEAKITFDDQFLYVGFKIIDPVPGPWVTTSLRRDFRGNHNDVISVIFDPFSDRTNGIIFGINPFGVQREGLLSGITGSSRAQSGFSLSWDNKWYSEAKTYDGYWTAEMAIPFKTLRYKGGSTAWKANFYRLDSKTAERSTWGNIPRNQNIFSLAFSGDLLFDQPLPNPGANISIIPYVSGLVSRDFIDGSETEYKSNIGGDIKIGVTPSLNLDLTFNPDFSQVEADVQQSNLTRFELFYPEKRQFFLENQDIFASFGASRIRPFFSRRIGIAQDPNTSLFVQNKIHYGARLSGRIDKNWRMGIMNLQTAKDASITRPGYNYSILAVQRQLFARSNLSFIAINKQATNILENDSTLSDGISKDNYNRLVGIDYNLASADNQWYGKLFYHKSISPSNNNNAYSHGINLVYNV